MCRGLGACLCAVNDLDAVCRQRVNLQVGDLVAGADAGMADMHGLGSG